MNLVNFLANVVYKLGNQSIIVMAVINFIVFVVAIIVIKRAVNMLKPRIDKVNEVGAPLEWSREQIKKLKDMRKYSVIIYAIYANFTAIFPLLGILGTVAALVKSSDVTMADDFMVALSTTLLGVFFAIFFKVIDAVISGPLDIFIEDADHVIQKNEEKRLHNEA